MADFVKGLFGGAKSSISSAVPSDADFADFATAASPAPPSHDASSAFDAAAPTGGVRLDRAHLSSSARPYTKWYRVWERVSIEDFYQEMVIIPCLLAIILVNLWGTSANRKRANQWAQTYYPALESEFASVGFGGGKKLPDGQDVEQEGLAKAMADASEVPKQFFKETSKSEFMTYASGRQNVAWIDLKLTLYKRYNPFLWLGELVLSFFFDSWPAPSERMEATAYCFDGKEKALVASAERVGKDSAYDGFVFAVVHKDKMKQLRDDRYDLSLTATKDHPKLPGWATVMSESAEITEALLTKDVCEAIEAAGEDLEALIVTDQPIDAPKTLDDTIPRKRVSLATKLPSASSSPGTLQLFQTFLRLPDLLVNQAHFRPEALRRIKATREEEQRKIRKVDEDEKATERREQMDKQKKLERDQKLGRMSAEEQRKYLEKEKADERKRGEKKRTMKG